MKLAKRKSRAALAAFVVVYVVLVGGYHIGKDLAQRDNIQRHAN
jgi:hypothetical protein